MVGFLNDRSRSFGGAWDLSYLDVHLQKALSSKNIPPSQSGRRLITDIRNMTRAMNVNNVTRTMAYLHFFMKHPEIHWALLAHLVSRNAGWNMTDLKGEFLPKLLSEQEQVDYFLWLERGNWLIFQDAFPQLLLYEASKQANQSLFHLLPHLGVSIFMYAIWSSFWEDGNRDQLTISLIINEQNYIESRIIKNPVYKKKVTDTLPFSLQDYLNLNCLVFPYRQSSEQVELIGTVVRDFTSLEERVTIGKKLYALLFQDDERLDRITNWTNKQIHTGSRKDYWPHLFNDVRESLPGRLYNPQIEGCALKEGANRLYSPRLLNAWNNVEHDHPADEEWFQDWKDVEKLFLPFQGTDAGNITKFHCKSLEKLSFVVFTKKLIFNRRS